MALQILAVVVRLDSQIRVYKMLVLEDLEL